MAAEPTNSVIYRKSLQIAGKVVGRDLSVAQGAIDPSVFELIKLIGEIIAGFIEQCRLTPAQMQRPTLMQEILLRVRVRRDANAQWRPQAGRIASEICRCGETTTQEELTAGIEEINRDNLLLV